MAGWVITCSERYLEAGYELLKAHLLKETVLHADETWVQVLREDGQATQTKSNGWIYRTSGAANRKIAIYEYQETRSQEHPKAFLKDFKGLLHTDGYEVYHNLSPDITVIGCWSHLRRRFESILKNTPTEKRKASDAAQGMAYINALFELERKFEKLSADERYRKRLIQSRPISDAFFAWLKAWALCRSPRLAKLSAMLFLKRNIFKRIPRWQN